jgi:naphthoate synthase
VSTKHVSDIFDPTQWDEVQGFSFNDITYHRAKAHGTVRIAFNRPEIRNAFRPATVDELFTALDHARQSSDVGCVLLTGNGPSPKDGGWAFCSGGDQRIRGKDGYKYADGETANTINPGRTGRLHILEVQRLIRFMPKIVICVVPGWAAGGGHSLHVVSDLTLASKEHARFKQTDADVASLMVDLVRHIWRDKLAKSLRAKFSFLVANTRQKMHAKWAWSMLLCHTPNLKPPHCSGQKKSMARAQLLSAC